MELAHAVKAHPEDYRWALDAKQMVLFFEKASLRTRLTFEAAINTLGGSRSLSIRRSRRWASVSRSPIWRATLSAGYQ